MADTGWLVLGAAVCYGGLTLYTAALAIRARRARRTLFQMDRRGT